MSIRITEIFYSLQGESKTIGLPTVFVRLTGCPMRCQYCDTTYSFHGGTKYTIDEILAEVAQYNPRFVTVTGGEPLAQPECIPLLTELCDLGYSVSLETGGAMDIEQVDSRVYTVLDIKTPESGEEKNNRYSNLPHLKKTDAVKFVICSREDYLWSKEFVATNQLSEHCEVLFSPSAQQLPARDLADWVVEDNLPVRMQVQLHKILWGDEAGR